MNDDVDTIALASAAILDCNQGSHWSILADWLNSIVVRAETGHRGVDHDYAATFARALMVEEDHQ